MSADISSFDPSQFLDASTTEALVKRPPLPAGADFVATIGEIVTRTWTSKKEDAKVKSGIAVDFPLEIDMTAYPNVEAGGASKITLKGGVMLDLTPGGAIDWGAGKNGALRRYREALGMNTPGQPFNIRMMQGRLIRVKIKHRTYEGEIYDEVDSVSKA